MEATAREIDGQALAEALQLVSAQHGRLSNQQVRAMRATRRRVAGGAAGVVSVMLAMAGTMWLRGEAPPSAPAITREVATAAGQKRAVRLADGTAIWLNGATRLALTYTADRREVRLRSGEAFFDVAHDAARPFVVRTDRSAAQVLGTAFDVDLTRSQVSLAVYRGAVRFAPAGSRQGAVVKAGYRARIHDGAVDQPSRFDAEQPDWRRGWIDTTGLRLDDLIDVLNRQGRERVAPPPPALGGLVVSGRFQTNNPRQLLAAIGTGYGFAVVATPDRLEIRAAR